jgi:hypothetical protein
MWRLAAGRELSRELHFDMRNEGQGAFLTGFSTQAGITETSHAPGSRKHLAGKRFDELVQWMVQAASPDYCDR